MKNRILYTIGCLCLLLSGGCTEEKIPLYSGDYYLSFTAQENGDPAYIMMNFAKDAPLAEQTRVEIPVTLWGDLFPENVTYDVEVLADGTTGIEGIDYVDVKRGVFPKNKPSGSLLLTVNRNEELLATGFSVKIRLNEGDGYIVGPKKYNTATVYVTDRVSLPSWWGSTGVAMRLGDYYPVKFRLLSIYLDGDQLPTIDQYTNIEFGNIITGFKAWWIEQWNQGKYHYYAADGTTPLYETISD